MTLSQDKSDKNPLMMFEPKKKNILKSGAGFFVLKISLTGSTFVKILSENGKWFWTREGVINLWNKKLKNKGLVIS